MCQGEERRGLQEGGCTGLQEGGKHKPMLLAVDRTEGRTNFTERSAQSRVMRRVSASVTAHSERQCLLTDQSCLETKPQERYMFSLPAKQSPAEPIQHLLGLLSHQIGRQQACLWSFAAPQPPGLPTNGG